jgi:cytochrome c oxidase subunit 3
MNTTNLTADMSSESHSGEPNANVRAKKMLLYLAIFSMVMFFAGLTSAYVVLMKGEYWVKIGMPNAFWISTAIILASSLTFKLAVDATSAGNQQRTRMMLLITLLLGVGFAVSQFQGWQQLIDRGHFMSGDIESISGSYGDDYTVIFKGKELVLVDGKFYFPDDNQRTESLNERVLSKSNTASSFIYVLSGLHLLHLVGGLLFLIYLVIKSYRVQVSASNNLGYKQGATYWHFLDILWVYLFLFLLFIH